MDFNVGGYKCAYVVKLSQLSYFKDMIQLFTVIVQFAVLWN